MFCFHYNLIWPKYPFIMLTNSIMTWWKMKGTAPLPWSCFSGQNSCFPPPSQKKDSTVCAPQETTRPWWVSSIRTTRTCSKWWGQLKRSLESLSPPSQTFTPHAVRVRQPALWKTPPTPSHRLLSSLPLGRRYHSIRSVTTRLQNSFYSQAIRLLNAQGLITSVALLYAVLCCCFVFVWYSIAPHVNDNNINNHTVTL